MIDITELFCKVDDFLKEFIPEYEKRLLAEVNIKPSVSSVNLSEIFSIMVNFHFEKYRDFKTYL